MFDTWLDEVKVVSAKYRPDLHTFELVVKPEGTSTTHIVILNRKFFPRHPAFPFLDEQVQIDEDIKVILKNEKELELQGWKLEERKKKLLAHPASKFMIGKTKKKMLGQVYNAKVGITEQMEPYAYVDKFRFGPNEVKCIIKNADLQIPVKTKSLHITSTMGDFTYNADQQSLILPGKVFGTTGIHTLLSFLRKAKLV